MKKVMQQILNYFGYSLTKTNKKYLFKKDVEIKVGNFSLQMPSINPLIYTYTNKKDFSSELGIILKQVLIKYKNLTVIDVGANVGDSVAIIKSTADVPVISIEGDPFTFSYLQKNIAQFKNVEILNNFLGERDEVMNLTFDKKGWNTTLIPSKNEKDQQVQIVSLDSLLNQHFNNKENFKLLKIDTEGFDTIIIRGALKIIEETRPVIYFEYNRDNMQTINENGFLTLLKLKESGYNKVLFYDDTGKFLLSTTLSEKILLNQLHNYADGKSSLIYYYNLCVFHSFDNDIADRLIDLEMTKSTKI